MEAMETTEGLQQGEADRTDWLSIKDAAGLLGISEKGVRARIRRGSVVARQVATKHGDQWLVAFVEGRPVEPSTVDSTVPTDGEATEPPTASPGEGSTGRPADTPGENGSFAREREQLLARIADKEQENEHLRRQLDQRAAEAERWQVILLQHTQRIAALEEGNRRLLALPSIIQADGAETQREETAPASGESQQPPRRPWWRRLFGG